jgi:hypothetical protein
MAEYVPSCSTDCYVFPCVTQLDAALSHCTVPQSMAAVHYLWWHCGQGIFVRIIDGKIAEFVPFESTASNVRTPLKYAIRKRLSATEVGDVLVSEPEFWHNYEQAHGASVDGMSDDGMCADGMCVDGACASGARVTLNKAVQEWAPALRKSIQEVLDTEASREALCGETFEFVINVQSAAVRKDGKCPQTLQALPHDIFPHWLTLQNKCCVLSLSASPDHLDVVWPFQSEAASRAHTTQTVAMLEKPPFLKRENVAMFRGAPNGLGTMPEDNTRLFLLKLAKGTSLIDAKATSNCTDLQLFGAKEPVLKFVRPLRGADGSNFVPLYEQVTRKFVLFTGHASVEEVLDNSLANWLACGFCVIFVEPMSTVQAWFQHALKPWVHYVPVHKNKLVKMLEWLNANPENAERIARQGETFARTVLSDVSTFALGAKLMQAMAHPKKRTICETLGFSF